MDDEYYLTDTIRMKGDTMEYRVDDCQFRPVKNHNWHRVLSEYGWEKINKQWLIKLNKLSSVKERNSLYGVLDCESDGDCFFHCIANALNEKEKGNEYYDGNDIRGMISDNITVSQYDMIIGTYRIMKDADDFSEEWDPYSINSIDEFREKLKKSGHEYWGDHILLQVLSAILKVNIFILNNNTFEHDYSIYNTLNDINKEYGSIFLIYEDMCHFKLLGHFECKMTSYFNFEEIPLELKKLYEL